MEATPPQEPIRNKPEPTAEEPAAKVRKSPKSTAERWHQAAKEVDNEPIDQAAVQIDVAVDEVDSEQEATRVYGALALGIMAILLICTIALLIAYRHAPQGL
jgi:hypothetical protein